MLGIGDYLWRLVPANPILLRVVASAGKRRRDLLIRCAYLGALVFLVVFLLIGSGGGQRNSLTELTKESARIFWWMSYVQLALVTLLAPVFTAGAITQEKDSQTYEILLSTPLTNGQIVLGSLLSRLFFVVALLISGVPIFSITQIFGGVAISAIIMSFLIATATAFVTGALAMAIAVFKVGTRRTIFAFYLFIMLYLAIPMVLESMGYFQYGFNPDSTGKPTTHISWFAGIHPFLALRVIFGDPAYGPPDPGMVANMGWPGNWYLSNPAGFYVSFMMFLSFALIIPSILVLRRLAQSTTTLRSWILQRLRLSAGDRTRKPRGVWSNPIAWREAKTKASASRAVALRHGFMLVGIAGAATLLALSSIRARSANYIGLGGYNSAEHTITIVESDQPVVYRIRRSREGPGFEPTAVTINGQTSRPEDLLEGMAVRQYRPDLRGSIRSLASIDAALPETLISQTTARQFLLGAVMIELAVILLILTQSAASTVTREKEDGTLDLLLSTPITSRYYIWGKLRGLVSFVLPLMAVPIVSILMFVAFETFRWISGRGFRGWTVFPESVLILPATLVMVLAFSAMLGMHMSLRCRTTVMAVMSSVGIVAGACGTLWVCGSQAASSNNLGPVGVVIGSFSPFTLMALLINPVSLAAEAFAGRAGDVANYRALMFFFGWIAAACYGLVVWGMYKSMVHNFDMTIRKQST